MSLSKQLDREMKTCNLALIRALNAELMALVPAKEEPTGLTFQIDGNTHTVSPAGKESRVLLFMNERMKLFEAEEAKACGK